MNRFLVLIALALLTFPVSSDTFAQGSQKTRTISDALLDLPAPPPPHPLLIPTADLSLARIMDQLNPPPDDAPMEVLFAYWKQQARVDRTLYYAPTPRSGTVERFRELIQAKPSVLPEIIGVFSGDSETLIAIKNLYDNDLANRRLGTAWRQSVVSWLRNNSPYFIDELIDRSMQVKDRDGYVTNQYQFLALAKHDWGRAEPIARRLLANSSQPVSQTLARWALYQHALDNGNSAEADEFRSQLMRIVEDRGESPGNRDLAFDALTRCGNFPGRDDWYFELLKDETLTKIVVNGRVYTGLTTYIMQSPPGAYDDRLIELLDSESKTVRSAAVRSLFAGKSLVKPEAIRRMIPWLADADWAQNINGSRLRFIEALEENYVPESVPGLISVLNEIRRDLKTAEQEDFEDSKDSDDDSESLADNSWQGKRAFETVIIALGNQRDARALSALRSLADEKVIKIETLRLAILRCGGYSVPELVEAVEFTSRHNTASTDGKLTDDSEDSLSGTERAKLELAGLIPNAGDPSTALVDAVTDRAAALAKSEPSVSAEMYEMVRAWSGSAVDSSILRRIEIGQASAQDILTVLARRTQIRENQMSRLLSLGEGDPLARGVSACILDRSDVSDTIISGSDDEATIALLACARLIRSKLDVRTIGDLMSSKNDRVAIAAEKYLVSEDSRTAREIVRATKPGEMVVLGARTAFPGKRAFLPELERLFESVIPGYRRHVSLPVKNLSYADRTENQVRADMLADPNLHRVIALSDPSSAYFLKVFKDRALLQYQDSPGRYREWKLNPDDADAIVSFLNSNNADEMPPFLGQIFIPGEVQTEDLLASSELLVTDRSGGRRVFTSDNRLEFFERLFSLIEKLQTSDSTLHYRVGTKIRGFELLSADPNQYFLYVWKSGSDFRVFVQDRMAADSVYQDFRRNIEELQNSDNGYQNWDAMSRLFESVQRNTLATRSWREFRGQSLGQAVREPAPFTVAMSNDSTTGLVKFNRWRSRADTVEIFSDKDGLYKLSNGNRTLLANGSFIDEVISSDGRFCWAYDFDRSSIVKFVVATGSSTPIQKTESLHPVAFLRSNGKILVAHQDSNDLESERELYLLDSNSGAIEPATGRADILLNLLGRPLQPIAGRPGEFWAAVTNAKSDATEIGIFTEKSLSFRPVFAVPELTFESADLWIDETERKVYLTYQGQLVRFDLVNQ